MAPTAPPPVPTFPGPGLSPLLLVAAWLGGISGLMPHLCVTHLSPINFNRGKMQQPWLNVTQCQHKEPVRGMCHLRSWLREQEAGSGTQALPGHFLGVNYLWRGAPCHPAPSHVTNLCSKARRFSFIGFPGPCTGGRSQQ